jgi:hypothetical protein
MSTAVYGNRCLDCGGRTKELYHIRCPDCHDSLQRQYGNKPKWPNTSGRKRGENAKWSNTPGQTRDEGKASAKLDWTYCRMCEQVQVTRTFCDDCYQNKLHKCHGPDCDRQTLYLHCGACYSEYWRWCLQTCGIYCPNKMLFSREHQDIYVW